MSISIPDRFYDYVLYYECGYNEKAHPSMFKKVGSLPAGSLLNAVKWDSKGNDVGDGAGITRFGVTPNALSAYRKWSKNNSFNVNSAASWMQIVNYFWRTSSANDAAHVSCSILLCQGKWSGWGASSMREAATELRRKVDKDVEKAKSITGNTYRDLSQLTHCFKDPLDAFLILRACRIKYLRSRGNASKFAGGWMRREFFALQGDGLYCEPGTEAFTRYGFTPIAEMERVAEQLKKNDKSGYQLLLPWGEDKPNDNVTDDIDDGSNPDEKDFRLGDIGMGFGYNSGQINGGTIEFGMNSKHEQKGVVVGLTIRQK